jgi:uncharacterized membrane protein YqaE (UPF0057 family)
MGATIPSLLLAVLLPPLAVFLRYGLCREFWIDVALTILAWVPGVILALALLLRAPGRATAAR